jgi:hypothetical protein
VVVQAEEYLPRKARFTIEVQKSQSQGCRAKFTYRVKLLGPKEFRITITRVDLAQGWEHDLHLRWQASGAAPELSNEEKHVYDEEIAHMVGMGYDADKARRALQMRGGDLGAAASFIGACDVADKMSVEDSRLAAATAESAAEAEVLPKAEPLELTDMGHTVTNASAISPNRRPNSRPLMSNESMVEHESIADWDISFQLKTA